MIRLLIVDDEKMTRDSLLEYIQSKNFGFDEIDTAKNGLAALDIARSKEPHIVLCDVRMPKMNGIELASSLRELYPDCKIIFISGFTDKEYLKSAITLKAISYIEKPIILPELEEVLNEALNLHREELKKKLETQALINGLAASVPLVRQEVALELISPDFDISKLQQKYSSIYIDWNLKCSFTAASLLINHATPPVTSLHQRLESDLVQVLSEYMKSFNDNYFTDFLAGSTKQGRIAFILKNDSDNRTNLSSIFRQLLQRALEQLPSDISVSIGIGPTVRTISQLHYSYSKAVEASERQFFMGANNIYLFTDREQIAYPSDSNPASALREHLKGDRPEEAKQLLKQLTAYIKLHEYSNISNIKSMYSGFLSICLDLAQELGWDHQDKKNLFMDQITGCLTLDKLLEYVLSVIDRLYIDIDEKNNTDFKVYEVKKYISRHYSNSNLSIKTIADNIYLTENYLCTLFKKTTGQTINDYITRVRIDKAKELLKEGNLKLFDIANRVGINDPNYLSTLFKKVEGCTPSRYKERYFDDQRII